MPLLNFRLSRPAALIDLNRIAALAYIREDDGHVALGAMTRQRTIEFSPVVRRRLPLLAEATRWSGICRSARAAPSAAASPTPIPRRSTRPCSPRSEGEVVVRGAAGRAHAAAGELFQSYLTTTLAADEMLVEVRLPAMPDGAGFAFEEFSRPPRRLRHRRDRRASSSATGRPLHRGAAGHGGGRPGARPPARRRGDPGARRAVGRGRSRPPPPAAELVEPHADIHASADYRRHLTRVLTARALRRAINNTLSPSGGEGRVRGSRVPLTLTWLHLRVSAISVPR